MAFDTIHETFVTDILDIIKGVGFATADALSKKGTRNVALTSSLTKATKGLIMEFPVLVSKSNHIESAGIVSKAYEAKFVTLLQLAFSAANLSSSKDAFDYIKNFHTNLDYDKIDVDDFIDIMDNIVQHNSTNMSVGDYEKYRAVTEDMRNLSYYFGDDINESSLNSYKIMNNYGRIKVVKEDTVDDVVKAARDAEQHENDKIRTDNDSTRTRNDSTRTANDTIKTGNNTKQTYNDTIRMQNDTRRTANDTRRTQSQINRNDIQNQNDAEKLKLDQNKDARDAEKLDMDRANFQRDNLPTNLLSSDVKKANELTPTMLVINFVIGGDVNTQPINQSVIIGVKAKLYEVESADVINKLITKHVDSNILLKLVKLSTREISFAKDFLLAVDDAKLDALSRSRKGSSNKLFKVLERRALTGKVRKMIKGNNYAKAISSIVISQEEAEELLKNNIDVNDPKIVRPIMEKLNLISFAIIDESSESVRFIWDTGDDIYETIPLSKLEKEQKDGMSRQVINLLAKMNR